MDSQSWNSVNPTFSTVIAGTVGFLIGGPPIAIVCAAASYSLTNQKRGSVIVRTNFDFKPKENKEHHVSQFMNDVADDDSYDKSLKYLAKKIKEKEESMSKRSCCNKCNGVRNVTDICYNTEKNCINCHGEGKIVKTCPLCYGNGYVLTD